MSDVQRFGDEVQRAGKDGFDAAVSVFGEANKGVSGYCRGDNRLFEAVLTTLH
jgi:hypothetical protein